MNASAFVKYFGVEKGSGMFRLVDHQTAEFMEHLPKEYLSAKLSWKSISGLT